MKKFEWVNYVEVRPFKTLLDYINASVGEDLHQVYDEKGLEGVAQELEKYLGHGRYLLAAYHLIKILPQESTTFKSWDDYKKAIHILIKNLNLDVYPQLSIVDNGLMVQNIDCSSNLQKVIYSSREKLLVIQFMDKTLYMYKGVPKRVVTGLLKTTGSIGQYFSVNIRYRYQYEKVQAE